MRRILSVLVVFVCLLATNVSVASADGAGAGDVDVKGQEGRYQGRLDISRKRNQDHQQRHRAPDKVIRNVHRPEPKLSKTELAAIEAMCRESPDGICHGAPKDPSKPTQARAVASLSAIARTLIVRLKLPDPTPRFGPDPAANEWRMAAVGYPLWLWTDGPTTVTSRVRAYGVTFTLRATWRSTTFDMGDGHRVNCTRTRSYPDGVAPGTRSPVCGYTYLESSLPKGNYRVTATTNWRIAWSALGQSGSLPGSHSGSWSLPVGELNALVVR